MDEKIDKWIAEMDRKTRETRERYKVSDRRQPNLPAQQQQQKKETAAEHLKEQIETIEKKKPKAKLVKSEWQKQRDKERQNSRGISR